MSGPGGVLERILVRTREAIDVRRREVPLERLRDSPVTRVRRSFADALARPGRLNVIAEYKRRSPSRGPIREDLGPVDVAQAYERGGAAALSVLTEEQSFGGKLADLSDARAATGLPVLRKDFIVDPYQVWEARHAGADALLLIVAALRDEELKALLSATGQAGLDALVEVHDREELGRALAAGARLVGVNNRDLRTLEVTLRTSLELAPHIPEGVIAVAESGLRTAADLRQLREAGFSAFLVGEHLMQAPEPGVALQQLLAEAAQPAPAPPGRLWIKVCGLTRVEDALAAAEAGADAIGLVFWPQSPRHLTREQARGITEALPPFVTRVGVFVDASLEEMAATADAVGLDLLQLHGEEPPELAPRLPRRALKALRAADGLLETTLAAHGRLAAGLLLDSGSRRQPGGTGRTFDWSLATRAREHTKFLVLAGGLDPGNVAEAIRAVRPQAVDVSSGVESAPGRKDARKVAAFVAAARSAMEVRP